MSGLPVPPHYEMLYQVMGDSTYKSNVIGPSVDALLSPLSPENRRSVLHALFYLDIEEELGCNDALENLSPGKKEEINGILNDAVSQIRDILSKLDPHPPSIN